MMLEVVMVVVNMEVDKVADMVMDGFNASCVVMVAFNTFCAVLSQFLLLSFPRFLCGEKLSTKSCM